MHYWCTGQEIQPSSSGGFKWWMGLIIGLVVLLALVAVAITVWVLMVVRRRRREQQQQRQLPTVQENGKVNPNLAGKRASGFS